LEARELDYLGGLASYDVIIGTEVVKVVGRHARFSGTATWVATDNASVMELGDIGVEGRTGRYVLEVLAYRRVVPAEGEGYHLC